MTPADRQALVARLEHMLATLDNALENMRKGGDSYPPWERDASTIRDVLALLRADEAEPLATPAPSRPAGGAAQRVLSTTGNIARLACGHLLGRTPAPYVGDVVECPACRRGPHSAAPGNC
jgi:hypothetical protein